MHPPAIRAAHDALGELLATHYALAEESADDEGRFSIGLRVTFDRSHDPVRLKVTCRVAKVVTDEIQCTVDDPAQPKLPL